MSSINETITAVASSALGEDATVAYSSAIEALTTALTEREYDITERIVNTVYTNRDEIGSLNRDDLEQHASYLGLSVRPQPEPEPEVEEEPAAEAVTIEDRVVLLETGQAQLQEGMNTLLAIAKRLAPSEF